MTFVSTPYDVPFSRFVGESDAVEIWAARREGDPPRHPDPGRATLPRRLLRGDVLAFTKAPHELTTCVGGAVLGPDQLPPDFVMPDSWSRPLPALVNDRDLVPSRTPVLGSLVPGTPRSSGADPEAMPSPTT